MDGNLQWHTVAEIMTAMGAFLRGLAAVLQARKGKGPRSGQDRRGRQCHQEGA